MTNSLADYYNTKLKTECAKSIDGVRKISAKLINQTACTLHTFADRAYSAAYLTHAPHQSKQKMNQTSEMKERDQPSEERSAAHSPSTTNHKHNHSHQSTQQVLFSVGAVCRALAVTTCKPQVTCPDNSATQPTVT